MNYLQKYCSNILCYDYINKFLNKTPNNITKIKKIVLDFNFKTADIKHFYSSLVFYEFSFMRKGSLIKTKKSNIALKLRKGYIVGCKITLRKNETLKFLDSFLTNISINLKNFGNFENQDKLLDKSITYQIDNIFSFSELKKYYSFFNNFPKINVTLITNTNSDNKIKFYLKSLNF